MRFWTILLCCVLMLAGCAVPDPEPPAVSVPTSQPSVPSDAETPDPIASQIAQMTLEERVGQLFLARCDASVAARDAQTYHLAGFVLFGADFQKETPESVRKNIASYQSGASIPLLIAVDEEGGTVNRISRYPAFRSSPLPSPRTAYGQGGIAQALQNEEEKCILLSSLNINVNLGPVCDISTDPEAFMYQRSLGLDPQKTGDYVFRTVRLMDSYGIGSVLKHFPGYGNNADTHTGIAVDNRSLQELEDADLVPFTSGIRAGCGAVLVSHTIVSALDAELPASLSPAVHRYLRQEMDFSGVIVTDDLVMEAITDAYGAEEAAVLAVLAGNDLLCSTDYTVQYNAVLAAVEDGRIDTNTLDQAVYRVLSWKAKLGLLN